MHENLPRLLRKFKFSGSTKIPVPLLPRGRRPALAPNGFFNCHAKVCEFILEP
jgi:hypothetical protein